MDVAAVALADREYSLSLAGGGRILTLSPPRRREAAEAAAGMGMGMGSEEVVEKHCISVSAAYKSQNGCLDENEIYGESGSQKKSELVCSMVPSFDVELMDGRSKRGKEG